MSARSSSSEAPAAAVRTMKPPPPFSRSLWMIRFSRCRSSSEAILRDTPGVVHRRHEHQKASRQRDVTRDARALLADRLLGNLDQHFLSFLEQFADLRHDRILAARKRRPPPRRPRRRSTRPAARCVRCKKPRFRSGASHFCARIHRTEPTASASSRRLRFFLRFFEFEFLGFPLFRFQDCFGNLLAILTPSTATPSAARLLGAGSKLRLGNSPPAACVSSSSSSKPPSSSRCSP